MAKKDLSYKYDMCKCGERKLKRSLVCRGCQRQEMKGKHFAVSGAGAAASVDGCCVVCAARLKPKQKAFCGLPCRMQHLRVPERQCVGCEVTFKPKCSKSKYCTNECANRHKSVMYRRADSKMQKRKRTLGGYRFGACSALNFEPCLNCGNKKQSLNPSCKYCGSKCLTRDRYNKDIKTGKRKRFVGLTVCQWCGSRSFNQKHANKMFCSGKCSSKHHKAQRRHRKKAVVSERGINWKTAVNRLGWSCACCGIKCVKPQGFNLANEATLDHIRPIAKGGSHTWDNVQVLCRSCNTRKSDSESFLYDYAALTN